MCLDTPNAKCHIVLERQTLLSGTKFLDIILLVLFSRFPLGCLHMAQLFFVKIFPPSCLKSTSSFWTLQNLSLLCFTSVFFMFFVLGTLLLSARSVFFSVFRSMLWGLAEKTELCRAAWCGLCCLYWQDPHGDKAKIARTIQHLTIWTTRDITLNIGKSSWNFHKTDETWHFLTVGWRGHSVWHFPSFFESSLKAASRFPPVSTLSFHNRIYTAFGMQPHGIFYNL